MKAFSRALNYLARRSRTESEVRDYLLRKGHDASETDQCIIRLLDLDYLNDRRTAQEYISFHTRNRPWGRYRLSRELQRRGIDRDLIQELLCGIDSEQELELAFRALERKKFDSQQKLIRFLVYRGFSYEIASQVCRKLYTGND